MLPCLATDGMHLRFSFTQRSHQSKRVTARLKRIEEVLRTGDMHHDCSKAKLASYLPVALLLQRKLCIKSCFKASLCLLMHATSLVAPSLHQQRTNIVVVVAPRARQRLHFEMQAYHSSTASKRMHMLVDYSPHKCCEEVSTTDNNYFHKCRQTRLTNLLFAATCVQFTYPYFFKVRSHAGIAGSKCTDAIAKHQANQGDDILADTTFSCAKLKGYPFHGTTWIAFEEDARTHARTSERPEV
eukprot:1147536-Pelagomonas_calceolata.AAC.3